MTSAKIESWATATAYTLTETVVMDDPSEGIQFEAIFWRCISAHTSTNFATDFGNSYWEKIISTKGEKGDNGDKGDPGSVGPTGAAGANGANGATGANGIFSAIASQGEAETGTDNTKGMSPLRTAQAITAQVDEAGIIANTAQIATNVTNIDVLSGKVAALETAAQISVAQGDQACDNNSTTTDMVGDDIAGGRGNRLELSPVGSHSARIELEVYREDDAEIRFAVIEALLHFVNGTWIVGIVNETRL